ncbi:hypothetical protein AB0425_22510 [Actinosynnema sp. NPDC051121]
MTDLRISTADPQELRSLLDWLRSEDDLRGKVRFVAGEPSASELGAMDALAVALGSGGAGAVLARSLTTWLTTRRADLDVTVTGPSGTEVRLKANRVADPAALLNEIPKLLDQQRP